MRVRIIGTLLEGFRSLATTIIRAGSLPGSRSPTLLRLGDRNGSNQKRNADYFTRVIFFVAVYSPDTNL